MSTDDIQYESSYHKAGGSVLRPLMKQRPGVADNGGELQALIDLHFSLQFRFNDSAARGTVHTRSVSAIESGALSDNVRQQGLAVPYL